MGGIARAVYFGGGVIILPRKINGKLRLGFLASGFLGAVMAVIFDGSYITAILSGFLKRANYGIQVKHRCVKGRNTCLSKV